LASIFDPIPLWQFHRPADPLLNVLNCAAKVAARDVALDHDPSLHALTHDEVRTPVVLNGRHARQWNV
jgi:hypothetical protein